MFTDDLPSGGLEFDVDKNESNVVPEENSLEKTDKASVTELESNRKEKRSGGKSKGPLNMSFEERQNAAAEARSKRKAGYKIKADVEKEWVDSFREKTTDETRKK